MVILPSLDLSKTFEFISGVIILLCQDGLLRVLLDGGPSRVFFPSDAKLLEDDLEILKVLLRFHRLCCKNEIWLIYGGCIFNWF